MKTQAAIDILDLAWDDYKGLDREAVGMAIVLLRTGVDGTLEAQMCANVDRDIIEYALGSMVRSWVRGEDHPKTVRTARTRKKTV